MKNNIDAEFSKKLRSKYLDKIVSIKKTHDDKPTGQY